ncbi:MAG: HD domain-containing protein, partial [Candidatus Omnitrophica bacterium]|nr:HD domain-containing protein [Candidatus Omnitrophota bacterium]
VIMNHVKEGVELARKYKLNHRLIDFIEQHHGTSLVYFFYRRALENLEEGEEVKEEGFRYPGPKPNSRETAIVLLADSVEAAIRTLKEPDIRQIEDSVHKIINNKFIEGQLDECDLTLKDLEKISKVFIHILNGIYHTRITYPENTQGESSNPELKKEDPSKPPKDKKGGS